jgi:ankyrin repeat protein
MAAAYRGHKQILYYLIDRGAKLNLVDRLGRTALTWAARRGKDDSIVQYLLKEKLPVRLMEALLLDDYDRAQDLINDRSAVRGPDNETTLMVAAEKNQLAIVQALSGRGNPNHQDVRGLTALMVAIGGRPVDFYPSLTRQWPKKAGSPAACSIVRELIKAGARVEIKNKRGESAKEIAAEVGDSAIGQLLHGN